ncbi:energy-coupling factor transport system ATP-binding protein [Metabacillus crassostreae]|uniref:ABC transporter ATP-binding protein n=1 Tax=Metabacillus crassostreae TaxID=929098 RepID=UPI00195D0327|nr:ABC transporter ATP-binding protein [Metabacillus crassostreae]MBM7605896.1 energy-coupling factor transport system ATP-binding protein [Metabacillus crassostreae]
MAFLETKNLSFAYPEEKIKVLNDVSFSVEQGDFVVLCGPSGSGKSTLLRLLKQELAPHGEKEGDIFLENKPLLDIPPAQVVKDIGMVFQDPENQIVMDRVLEELIFGMENFGTSTEEMRKKVAEIVHFFGIEGLLNRKTHELSGGQKQLVNLASVLLLEPKLLLLDEPTSQLDPVAAREFIGMLQTMNEEFGITVIIAEHRLEELFAIADKALVLDNGGILSYDTPRHVIDFLSEYKDHAMYHYLPSPARLYLEYSPSKVNGDIPLSVKEGKNWLKNVAITPREGILKENHHAPKKEIMNIKEVDFQYSKDSTKILNDLSLSIFEGEWLSIVGANGTGKSTLLKVIAGLEKPQRGSIFYKAKKFKKQLPKEIGYLPQNPKLFFIHDTIGAELRYLEQLHQIGNGETRIEELLKIFNLKELVHRHPYDVSGGEMQKAALAGVLLPNPKLLLIDEPTKGLDPEAKLKLGKLLQALQQKGLTIVMVTHDIEFAAHYSTRCAMMFQGTITTNSPTKSFFQGNAFYTTVLNRITRGSKVPDVLTLEEARKTWHVQE